MKPNKSHPGGGLGLRFHEFVEILSTSKVLLVSTIHRLLWDLQIDPSDPEFRKHVLYDSSTYKRNFIVNTPEVQSLVLCWLPGQGSPIHSHGVSNCGMKIIKGVATETLYTGLPDEYIEGVTETLSEGHIRVSHGGYVHRVQNRHATPMVSLHVYSPPLLLPRS